ncbi:MAG: helix-turn-helix transcriptional regulator [Bacteroidaceae bacterium]|nr:helix-turn-helix transcriptional regulator [Bacteroidaceae bacterium]
MEMIRQQTPPEVQKQVDMCVAIANRVYDLLEERGMSQRDLARALGKTETEVSRWLSGTHNLTIATIAKMATVLGDDIINATSSVWHETYQYHDAETEATMVAEDVAEYWK